MYYTVCTVLCVLYCTVLYCAPTSSRGNYRTGLIFSVAELVSAGCLHSQHCVLLRQVEEKRHECSHCLITGSDHFSIVSFQSSLCSVICDFKARDERTDGRFSAVIVKLYCDSGFMHALFEMVDFITTSSCKFVQVVK